MPDEAPGYVVLFSPEKNARPGGGTRTDQGRDHRRPGGKTRSACPQWQGEILQGRFDAANSINFNRDHQDLAGEIAKKADNRLSGDPEVNIRLIRELTKEILDEADPADEAESLKLLLFSLSHDSDIVLDLHCDLDALLHILPGNTVMA